MNRFCAFLLGILPIVASGIFSSSLEAANSYTYSFADSSPLASGRWVRISTGESGIYEIPYSTLREMGFSDPERVGVFGTGGTPCSFSFESFTSKRLYEDTPQPVAVWHEDDRLLFYAQGTSSFEYSSGKFIRSSINLYSFRGHYLLSDSQEPLTLPSADIPGNREEAYRRVSGYDYVWHERDLKYNTLGSGRLFWGENMLLSPELTFPVELPFAASSGSASLNIDMAYHGNSNGTLSVSLAGVTRDATCPASALSNVNHSFTGIPLFAGESPLVLQLRQSGAEVAALDKWIITYPKSFSFSSEFAQERISFPGLQNGLSSFTLPEGMTAIDVSSPASPKKLPVEGATAYFTSGKNPAYIVAFDSSKTQFAIGEDWEVLPPLDLHRLQHQYNELLIITQPEYQEYADKIADLHREYDRIGVAVVNVQDVYDEFNSGTPDPMAYRALVKLMYQARTMRLRNVLFLGPAFADSRNVEGCERPNAFVTFLHPANGFELDEAKVPTVHDWPGYVSDVIYNENFYFREPVEVGVGYLPVTSAYEAELAVSKIADFLRMSKEGGMERYANKITIVGGSGDDRLHYDMAVNAANYLDKMAGELSDARFDMELLSVEDRSEEECRDALSKALEEGSALTMYFGHGSSSALNGELWSSSNFMTLRNRPAGFMLLAGCRLSETDHGRNGVGDIGVLRAPHALVGAITASRTVYAERNAKIMEAMQAAMLTTDSVTPRHTNATIGEIYALGKSLSKEDVEAAFYYVGDPALQFPLAVNPATVHPNVSRAYVPGEILTLYGSMMTSDNEYADNSASGDLMIRIYEPSNPMKIAGRESLPVRGNLIATVKGTFKQGRYSGLRIQLDKELEYLQDAKSEVALPIYVTGYDSRYGRAYCGNSVVMLAPAGKLPDSTAKYDTQAPSVAAEYDPATLSIRVSAADETALNMRDAISVFVDGIEMSCAPIDETDLISRSYIATVPVGTFEEGRHFLTAVARDLAGNVSSPESLSFLLSKEPALELSCDSSVATDRIEFRIEGNDALHSLLLLIADAEGKVVATVKSDADSAVWNCEGMPPGVYSAAVAADSAAGAVIRSPRIYFSVID